MSEMIKKEFKPYFDIKKHSDEVVARVFQEERNGTGDLKLRVVHAEKYDRTRISTDKWEYNKHSGAEKEATKHAFELAGDGFGLIVWISPKSDIYEEGRLNVMLPSGDSNRMDPWGIPLKLGENESMELAERLLEAGGLSMDPITDPESLRRQPVGFRLNNDENWLDKCRELMPEMEDIWNEMGRGGVDVNMKNIVKKVRRAKEAAGGSNIVFEMEMAKMGYLLNVAGDHGGSWLSTLNNEGIYNYKLTKISGVIYTEKVKVRGRWICPLCGREITDGETVCGKCGAKMK